MSIFKNSTSPAKVGGSSMYFPQEKGDTSKWWSSMGSDKSMKGNMPKGKKSKEKM